MFSSVKCEQSQCPLHGTAGTSSATSWIKPLARCLAHRALSKDGRTWLSITRAQGVKHSAGRGLGRHILNDQKYQVCQKKTYGEGNSRHVPHKLRARQTCRSFSGSNSWGTVFSHLGDMHSTVGGGGWQGCQPALQSLPLLGGHPKKWAHQHAARHRHNWPRDLGWPVTVRSATPDPALASLWVQTPWQCSRPVSSGVLREGPAGAWGP